MCKDFVHLKQTNLSYSHHFFRSLLLSLDLYVGSVKALIHSIYPDIFVTSTTDLVIKLHKILVKNPKNIH
jgi:hypothetical protein